MKSRITWSSIVTRLQRTAQSVGPKLDALRRRFHRRPAGEVLERVVTQQAEIADLRPGRQRLRRVARPRNDAHRRDAIHVRRARRLERRLAAERLLRLIGRTIGDYNYVFHGCEFGADSAWPTDANLISHPHPHGLPRAHDQLVDLRARLPRRPFGRLVRHDHQRHGAVRRWRLPAAAR